jgi:hypothetical protein
LNKRLTRSQCRIAREATFLILRWHRGHAITAVWCIAEIACRSRKG